ncbi:ABC transporter substrate-binding protein [Jatrophihabitans sp. YIM 134969]
MKFRLLPLATLVAVGAAALAACAPADDDNGSTASGSGSAATNACTPDALDTLAAGKFTFGTDQPVYEPWFVDDTPTNGKGFESAVAYAVAEQLGYSQDQVAWTRVTFNAAIAPGPKTFDADINEFSITDERKQAVDFSSPYYDVTQAVVALNGSKAAGVTDLAGLKDLKLGAQVGTTSYTAITDVVKPSQQPSVFNTNDDAKAALTNKQIDALVVDLPTAFYITSAELENSKIVGQLPESGGTAEQFGMVLDKGSPLTTCVSGAVDALRSNGTLDKLVDQWLSQAGSAPELS